MNWDWSQLVDIRIADGQVVASVGPVVWILVLAALATWLIWHRPWRLLYRRWRVFEIRPTFLGTTWRIERDRETARLAQEAYVELITRKAAIEFEEDNDVLTEVYDSWYALFGEVRRLARQLDADDIAGNADLRQLHDLLVAVLNEGLRPHLTRWHARFQRWYLAEADAHPGASPQEVQRAYPDYDELVASLREANQLLIGLAGELKKLAHGKDDK